MKLSEKKKSVAGKMLSGQDNGNPHKVGSNEWMHWNMNKRGSHVFGYKGKKGKPSLSPVKHKVDVAGQESYKEEDK